MVEHDNFKGKVIPCELSDIIWADAMAAEHFLSRPINRRKRNVGLFRTNYFICRIDVEVKVILFSDLPKGK